MTHDNTPAVPEREGPVQAVTTTPMTILERAVEKGASADELAKLMELAERHEANQARKAFVRAMADFKASPPRIVKDREVSFGGGKTAYKHATLGNVTDTINAVLSSYGLSASWTTDTSGEKVSVTCRITHTGGHHEETTLAANPDNSGSKNSIQAVGSTVTYLQRYTLLALLGLATYDQENDGAGATVDYITEAQQGTIYDLLDAMGRTPEQFSKWLVKAIGAETIDTIPANKFDAVVKAIKDSQKGA